LESRDQIRSNSRSCLEVVISNYLALKYFRLESNWGKLFQKHVGHTGHTKFDIYIFGYYRYLFW